ncbi:MAG TPA: alpha-ketoglutarate-dependent dioxygenase AlkB [Kofleriaceae bacterium]|nr:alpha-ketoglutarate-dependent dioxygenase AlkB [Kofleriaceae bacterium]
MQLDRRALDDSSYVLVGSLPAELVPDAAGFARWWDLHPETFHEIKMHGKLVKTPRWQQAYGADYRYTGNTNRALPIPDELAPLHAWILAQVDPRLNGLLLNWYDAERGQYIGKHRDSTIGMIEGAPILTLSFGAARTFRIRRWKGGTTDAAIDFPTGNGTILVMPYATNLAWTHEVPHSAKVTGRRISITARAFTS